MSCPLKNMLGKDAYIRVSKALKIREVLDVIPIPEAMTLNEVHKTCFELPDMETNPRYAYRASVLFGNRTLSRYVIMNDPWGCAAAKKGYFNFSRPRVFDLKRRYIIITKCRKRFYTRYSDNENAELIKIHQSAFKKLDVKYHTKVKESIRRDAIKLLEEDNFERAANFLNDFSKDLKHPYYSRRKETTRRSSTVRENFPYSWQYDDLHLIDVRREAINELREKYARHYNRLRRETKELLMQ